jgi:hypothetical protein
MATGRGPHRASSPSICVLERRRSDIAFRRKAARFP